LDVSVGESILGAFMAGGILIGHWLLDIWRWCVAWRL